MKHKARIILNYDGTLWYEIEGESIHDITSEITKVYECKDFFERTSTLVNKGFAYFEPDTDLKTDIVASGQISSESHEIAEDKAESRISSEQS